MSNLNETEQEKYSKMWDFPQYHNVLNVHFAKEFINYFQIKPPTTFIDFGCGEGVAVKYLKSIGIHCIGVDIVKKPHWQFEMIQAPLWDIKADIKASFGLCTDVLEHIPTDKIELVLENIKERVTDKVFFNISLRPDGCGSLINEVLHLTVKPLEWWKEILENHFQQVMVLEYEKDNYMNVVVKV